MPITYKEKDSFRELIKNGVLKNEDSVPKFEENFEEAIKNVNNSIVKTQVKDFFYFHKLKYVLKRVSDFLKDSNRDTKDF